MGGAGGQTSQMSDLWIFCPIFGLETEVLNILRQILGTVCPQEPQFFVNFGRAQFSASILSQILWTFFLIFVLKIVKSEKG